MANYQKQHKTLSGKVAEDAQAMARATQKPGQTKEQTKLIAQGIQKGIEQYKKQQKAKARELDKRLKSVRNQPGSEEAKPPEEVTVVVKQHWLPWSLLLLSWLAMTVFWLS